MGSFPIRGRIKIKEQSHRLPVKENKGETMNLLQAFLFTHVTQREWHFLLAKALGF